MRNIKYILLLIAVAVLSTTMMGQGIVIFTKDGGRTVLPSVTVDSIVSTYLYNLSQLPTPPEPEPVVTKTFTVNGVSFNMIQVKGGTFTMGGPEEYEGSLEFAREYEYPRHSVTLSDYYIGETEVTQALWQAVTGQIPTESGPQWSDRFGIGDNYPAYYMNYSDISEFITKLNQLTGANFRLPTEAEWEFAARGGNRSHDYEYSGSENPDYVAWHSCDKSHPVATKAPNELGIYDMSGNVFEKCSDHWAKYPTEPQTNPTGPASGNFYISRGGDWSGDPVYCRVSYRSVFNEKATRAAMTGFRLASSGL